MRLHSKSSDIFVAGGISSSTIAQYLPYEPEVFIVGGGICSSDDPVTEAKAIHAILKRK